MRKSLDKAHPGYRLLCLLLLVLLAIFFIFPLFWIISGSFKSAIEINSTQPTLLPKAFTTLNYEKLFAQPAWLWLLNTVIMAVAAMLITCISASMAGYVLAKKHFFGRKLLFSLFVAAMALPKQVILIPLLREMAFFKLHDNLWAIILPTAAWPFGVFLMKQFSEGIPGEMIEAARIDGASEFKIFSTIVLPILKPGIGALAIFTFIASWNDYFLQLIMINSTKKLTISLGIAKLQAEQSTDFGLIMAGAALAALPIITVFLLFQKYFTQGVTVGAVKG
ncbi:MAG: carbohydrate ABC transporter permease [Eubacteriales bacterium]|nr:carbohydrate ABC transporter permease [Eubacteriales bacterium]